MVINGETIARESLTLMDYVQEHGLELALIAVEVNGKIMPKESFPTLVFGADDVVEVVSFVGGG